MADISQITLPDSATYDIKDATLRSNVKVVATVDWNTSTDVGTINKTYSELYSAIYRTYSVAPVIDYCQHGNVIFSAPTHYYLFLYSNDSDNNQLIFRSPTNGYGYEISIKRNTISEEPGYEDVLTKRQLTPVGSWGGISGSISNQTDLQTALGNKQDTLTAGTNITIDANNVISATGGASLDGVTILISASGWDTDTFTINGVAYHRYVTSTFSSLPENPVIGIGVAPGSNLPTLEQQEAYDTWNYAINPDGAAELLWLFSRTIPAYDFYIFVQGAVA